MNGWILNSKLAIGQACWHSPKATGCKEFSPLQKRESKRAWSGMLIAGNFPLNFWWLSAMKKFSMKKGCIWLGGRFFIYLVRLLTINFQMYTILLILKTKASSWKLSKKNSASSLMKFAPNSNKKKNNRGLLTNRKKWKLPYDLHHLFYSYIKFIKYIRWLTIAIDSWFLSWTWWPTTMNSEKCRKNYWRDLWSAILVSCNYGAYELHCGCKGR